MRKQPILVLMSESNAYGANFTLIYFDVNVESSQMLTILPL